MTHKEPIVYKAFNTYTLAASGLFLVDTIPNIHIEKQFKVSNGFKMVPFTKVKKTSNQCGLTIHALRYSTFLLSNPSSTLCQLAACSENANVMSHKSQSIKHIF